MRHIIFGGDGFVGRHLAPMLAADGHEVIVADIVKSPLPHYGQVRFVQCDVTDEASVFDVGIRADDMVYNLSAKMLSPIQVRPSGMISSSRSIIMAPSTSSRRWRGRG